MSHTPPQRWDNTPQPLDVLLPHRPLTPRQVFTLYVDQLQRGIMGQLGRCGFEPQLALDMTCQLGLYLVRAHERSAPKLAFLRTPPQLTDQERQDIIRRLHGYTQTILH